MGVENRVFVRKSSGTNLYKWSPSPNNVHKKTPTNKRPYFCSAVPNTQGEDWITTYSYDLMVVNFEQHRIAYVQCDYVS